MMPVSPERCAELEAAYLRHILICTLSRDRNIAVWRQLLDPWFAYRSGALFVKTTEAPATFNPSEQDRYTHVMACFPFRSVGAGKILDGLSFGPLVKEHTVPVAAMRDFLLESMALEPQKRIDTEAKLRDFLDANYRVGMVTRDEHVRLSRFDCTMPSGWKPGDDPFARYHATEPPIEIELLENRS
jgi:hypothetical protein